MRAGSIEEDIIQNVNLVPFHIQVLLVDNSQPDLEPFKVNKHEKQTPDLVV